MNNTKYNRHICSLQQKEHKQENATVKSYHFSSGIKQLLEGSCEQKNIRCNECTGEQERGERRRDEGDPSKHTRKKTNAWVLSPVRRRCETICHQIFLPNRFRVIKSRSFHFRVSYNIWPVFYFHNWRQYRYGRS